MDERTTGFGGWGIVIFLIMLFWAFSGGFGGLGARNAYAAETVPNCQIEKQEIIDSARTQYLVEQSAKQTQEQAMAGFAALGNKIDYYEYQDLRDQLAQERAKNMALEGRLYSDAKFSALEAQIANISCNMLRRPDITGIGAVCPNAGVINGLGLNNLNQFNGNC